MTNPRARGEGGSALLITVMLLMMLGLVGLAALNTTTRDQQVAGFQNRKRMALYAADAGISEALERLTTTSTPTISTTDLGDTSLFPYGRPSYRPDPTTASPTKDLGNAPFPGMGLNLGQGGLPTYQINYWRLRVQGLSFGGTQAKVEAVSGSLAAN
jgi:Tfp pilus assembly protein PilX